MNSQLQYLVFDIETISDASLIRQIFFQNQSLSDVETLKKLQNQRLEEGKSDFIPATFQLPISLAFAGVNEKFDLIGIATLDRPHFRPQEIAKQFWNIWSNRMHPTLVTYNGRGFDIPLLEQCAFRYGLSIPAWFSQNGPSYQQARNRYNSNSHFDIMEFMSNFGASRQDGGLNLSATLLGKPGKMETSGGMVQELWNQGEKLRIDDYCLCDSLDTYFVFLRTQVMLGKLTLEEELEKVEGARLFLENQVETYPILEEYLSNFQSWHPLDEDAMGFYSDFIKR